MEKINGSTAVIMAALNEEAGIAPTVRELQKFLVDAHLMVVDGRSDDGTIEVAEKMGAHVVLQKGKGKGHAIGQGIEALGSDVKYVVFIDADFTYPAEYLPKMIKLLEENPDVGMVIGNRFNDHFHLKAAMTNAFYAGNRLLAFAQHMFNGIKLRDPLSGLRVVRWEILKDWTPKSEGFDVEAEMNYLVERQGYGIMEIPIHYRPRVGKKKLKLKHGFTILKRIVGESFTWRFMDSE